MIGVAVVDMLPDVFHAGDFGSIIEMFEELLLKIVGSGARNHAGDVHVGVAGTSEAKIDDANHVVV